MVVDTSAIMAILLAEPDAARFARAIGDAEVRLISAASVLECAIVSIARFGKGRHPAALNYGDCFSYALAKSRNEALLYKGNDFPKTDLTPALGHFQ